jgi:threonine/homoserine/homoserine lactone efflux protein
VFGVTAAMGTLLTASVALNSVLVAIVPKIMIIMQIIGSLYMLYLAYQVLKMNISEDAIIHTASFMSGFLMQFINPKAWLFIMTVIQAMLCVLQIAGHIISICFGYNWSCVFIPRYMGHFGTVFKRFLQKYQRIVNIT